LLHAEQHRCRVVGAVLHRDLEAELIGRVASAVPAAPSSGASVSLASRRYDYDPSGGTIPVLVQGTLSGVKAGVALAVAVNGTIVTTAQAYDLFGAIRLAATIPQEAVRPGHNRVDVYRVAGSGPGARLERLGGSG